MPDAKPPLGTYVSPEGVLVLAAAGATAAFAAMPIVLVPGVLAYGILTWLRVERWKDAKTDDAWRPVEPPLEGLTPPNAARVVQAVNVQKHMLHEIATAAPEHRPLLAASAERARELVRSTADLTRLLQRIEALLRVAEPRLAEGADLERRMKQTSDAAAREGYAKALAQHREKAKALAELRGRAERYDAQLRAIQLALETAVAQVVRIKSADGGAATTESARVAEALQSLSIDVEALAETVDETWSDSKGAGR